MNFKKLYLCCTETKTKTKQLWCKWGLKWTNQTLTSTLSITCLICLIASAWLCCHRLSTFPNSDIFSYNVIKTETAKTTLIYLVPKCCCKLRKMNELSLLNLFSSVLILENDTLRSAASSVIVSRRWLTWLPSTEARRDRLPSARWIPAPGRPARSCPPLLLSWGRPPSGSPAPGPWRPPASRAPAWWWPGRCPPWRWCGTASAPSPGPAGTAACSLGSGGARPRRRPRRCLWCSWDGDKQGK